MKTSIIITLAALVFIGCGDNAVSNAQDQQADDFARRFSGNGGRVTTYTLTVNRSSVAGGTVTVNGATYTNPTTHNANASVTVVAMANSGYTFTGWSGASTSINSSITVTMSGNLTLTATFTLRGDNEFPPTINVPVTFYDFRSDRSNPEFEQPHLSGLALGLVQNTLDADFKPVAGPNAGPNRAMGVHRWFRCWETDRTGPFARGDFTAPRYTPTPGIRQWVDNEWNATVVYQGVVNVGHDAEPFGVAFARSCIGIMYVNGHFVAVKVLRSDKIDVNHDIAARYSCIHFSNIGAYLKSVSLRSSSVFILGGLASVSSNALI